MNKVILYGRLGKKPELRYSGEMAVCRFSLAVDRKKKGEVDFISCVAFGKTAENLEKFFDKGSRICLDGRIQTGSYDKEGKKVYTTDIVVENFDFVDTKNESKKEEVIPEDNWQDALNDDGLPFN